MSDLIYSIVALCVFFILLVCEFLLPTGGLLGILAVGSLITAIALAFKYSTIAGIVVCCFVAISSPFFILFLIRIWPNTPVGKRMLNVRRGQTTRPPTKTTSGGTPLDELVGQRGVAKTNLLPSGLIMIANEKLDAVSTGLPIDADRPIEVVRIEAGHIQVRELSDDEIQADANRQPTTPSLLEDSLDSFASE